MDNLGILLIALALLCFAMFFLRIILISYRSCKQMRTELQELATARRQMEINVTSNNNCSGGGSGVSNMCPVIDEPNNITILPKTLDLPPSYDEAAFYPNKDQSLSGAASTLTILTSTNVESSNPSLAAAAGVVGPNEPPPIYEVENTVTTRVV
ncbi:uncharacterized protein [Drosophila tropicalis]|uniref:uncharacterized protein isoform X2 n=2 Tax=Drosophila tropicalis TaxID=46794 RepID=UPI0035ABB6B5